MKIIRDLQLSFAVSQVMVIKTKEGTEGKYCILDRVMTSVGELCLNSNSDVPYDTICAPSCIAFCSSLSVPYASVAAFSGNCVWDTSKLVIFFVGRPALLVLLGVWLWA